MKAVVFHGIDDIRLEQVTDPKIENKSDAIVRITTSAICGTDLHFARGAVGSMEQGTILGHEAVGVIEEVGKDVRNLKVGQRVIVPATVGCGTCQQCTKGQYSQCDSINPNGPEAGTTFFGGPVHSGSLQGCQAELVRVPFSTNNLIKIPDEVSDEKAIFLSDIFPTGFFSADQAKVQYGDVVAVLGCGAVGQFAIASCKLMGAARIFAIDCVTSRLDLAQAQGAEIINSDEEDYLQVIRSATQGAMVNVVIDTVGNDAVASSQKDGESYTLAKTVELIGKCGTISIIGVIPQTTNCFPIGEAMHKNVRMILGTCPHRRYIPHLLHLVQTNAVDPTLIIAPGVSIGALDAYENFDARETGWTRVGLGQTLKPKHHSTTSH